MPEELHHPLSYPFGSVAALRRDCVCSPVEELLWPREDRVSHPAMPHIERKDMRFCGVSHSFESVIVEPFPSLSHTSFVAMMFALFPRAELFSSVCSRAESRSSMPCAMVS